MNRTTPHSYTHALFALALVVPVAFVAQASAQQRQVVERVVATVNDEALFLSDLRRKAIPFLPQVMNAGSTTERQARMEQLYQQLLERLIDEEILLQTAADMRLRASRQEVDRAIENLRAQSGLDEDAFWELVKSQGMTTQQYREDMRRQVLQYKVINQRVRSQVHVSEEDIRQRFEEEQARNRRTVEYQLAHIFLSTDNASTDDARSQLETLKKALTAENFLQKAEEVGGGELGWIQQGDLPQSLEDRLEEMRIGEISEPTLSPSGVHLLWLRDKREGGSNESYEEAKARIQAKLTEKVMVEQQEVVISQLRRRAVVNRKL